jgi:hypothetical protein
MKLNRYVVGSMLILLSLIFVGCYTMLNHPAVMEDQPVDQNLTEESEPLDEAFSSPMLEVNHGENCIDCHTQRHIPLSNGYLGSNITIYEEDHGDISEYYWQITPSANFYYATPWWANEFYYTASPSQQLPGDNDLPTPNDFSRRRPSSTNTGSASGSIGGSSASSALSKELTDDNDTSNNSTSKRASTGDRQNAGDHQKKSSDSGSSTTKKTSKKTTEAK